MNYRYELQVAGEGEKWHQNAVVFPTHEEARVAGQSKWSAWTMATAVRVVETEEPANYHWVPGVGLQAIELALYTLPDGEVVKVEATVANGQPTITYTLADGSTVLAVKQPRVD